MLLSLDEVVGESQEGRVGLGQMIAHRRQRRFGQWWRVGSGWSLGGRP